MIKEFRKIDLDKGQYALVDVEDYEILSKFTWYLGAGNYAISRIENKMTSMHRYILKPDKNYVVDHIDGHRTDNRKLNLRVCTRKENSENRRKRKGRTTSDYTGVSYLKSKEKYTSRITRTLENNKRQTVHIGFFDDEYHAAYAFSVVNKSLRKFSKSFMYKVTKEVH